MMFPSPLTALASCLVFSHAVEVNITAVQGPPETDSTVFYCGETPLLIGNDGTADKGGFHAYDLSNTAESVADVYTGRTKTMAIAYGIGGRDVLITIAQPDSIMRVYEGLETSSFREVQSAQKKFLGDWSALCTWRSAISGEQYLYLFGKKQVVQILIRDAEHTELAEVSALFHCRWRALRQRRYSVSASTSRQSHALSLLLAWSIFPTKLAGTCTASQQQSQPWCQTSAM